MNTPLIVDFINWQNIEKVIIRYERNEKLVPISHHVGLFIRSYKLEMRHTSDKLKLAEKFISWMKWAVSHFKNARPCRRPGSELLLVKRTFVMGYLARIDEINTDSFNTDGLLEFYMIQMNLIFLKNPNEEVPELVRRLDILILRQHVANNPLVEQNNN